MEYLLKHNKYVLIAVAGQNNSLSYKDISSVIVSNDFKKFYVEQYQNETTAWINECVPSYEIVDPQAQPKVLRYQWNKIDSAYYNGSVMVDWNNDQDVICQPMNVSSRVDEFLMYTDRVPNEIQIG